MTHEPSVSNVLYTEYYNDLGQYGGVTHNISASQIQTPGSKLLLSFTF